mgnify:CR=1 FL=1
MSMKNDIIKEINKKENMLKKYISYHQYNMKEGEMWYAYFKESVPLQVSALSKEALITYIDKKEKEGFLKNLIKKSVYDWIEYARLSAQDYYSNVLIEFYKDKDLINFVKDKSDIVFNIAFNNSEKELIEILLNNEKIENKKFQIPEIKEYKKDRDYNDMLLIIAESIENNKGLWEQNNKIRKNFIVDLLLMQILNLDGAIKEEDASSEDYYKKSLNKLIKNLKIRVVKNDYNILESSAGLYFFDAIKYLYEQESLEKKELFIKSIENISIKKHDKVIYDFKNNLMHNYEIEKTHHELQKELIKNKPIVKRIKI